MPSVQISSEKAIQIILEFSYTTGSYFWKAQQYLMKEGLIDDFVLYPDYAELLKTLTPETLSALLEFI